MLELPVLTLPKLSEAGFAEIVPVAATPVPLTATDTGDFGALLAMVTLPLVVPAVCGAYCTLNVLLCPAAIVSGVVTPLTLTPAAVEPSCEMVRFAVPVLVMVTGCVFDCPSTRLPKVMLAGEMLIAGCTPVPESANPGAVPGASLVIPTVPPTTPVAVGAKVTCTCADCPAAKVAGVARPVSLKPAPEANTCEMCTAPWPLLVIVAESTLLPPTKTFPNVNEEGFNVKWPTGVLVPVPESATVAGDAGSLLTIEMLPVSTPVADGANCTPIVVDWPALITMGVAIPVTLKGAPLTKIAEIVRAAFPVFDNVTFDVVLLPTVALPASTPTGLTTSCGCGVAAVAVTGICTSAVVPSDWRLNVAEALPGVEPLNHTMKPVFCPGPKVNGNVSPEIVN